MSTMQAYSIRKDEFLANNYGYIAGSISGMVQVLIGQPFDILKVRLQASTNPEVTMGSVFKNLLKNEGPMGFYKGTTAPLIGTAGIISIQFGVLELMKNQFKNLRNLESINQLSLIEIAMSGSVACIAASILTVPVEHIRIRMQMQTAGNIQYTTTGQCFKSIYSNYGIKGIYKGGVPGIWRESVMGFQYGIYEGYKRLINVDAKYDKIKSVVCGGFAGITIWSILYPIDSIKSLIQTDSFTKPQFKNTINCIKQTPFKSLYKGIQPCLLRGFPVNAGGFLSYELTKDAILGYLERQNERY